MSGHAPHREGSPGSAAGHASPEILLRIIEKERELESALTSAKEEATAIIQQARDRSAALATERRKSAEKEAAGVREKSLAAARTEGERILSEGAGAVRSLEGFPAARIDAAVKSLYDMILPPTAEEVR
jgi:vacuolar-type H+-ATPase subunit H